MAQVPICVNMLGAFQNSVWELYYAINLILNASAGPHAENSSLKWLVQISR